jgi:transposase
LGAKQPELAGNRSSALSSTYVQPCQEFLCALPFPGQRITLDDSHDRVPRPAIAGFNGRKRHDLTDTIGLPGGMIVHPADIHDRDGAPALLARARSSFPWLRHIFADSGYAGDKLRDPLKNLGDWTIEIVKRSDVAKGFVLLPRRWVVERTLAWLNRNRRLAKDVEATIESAVTWLYIASVKLMSRRLAAA